MALAVACACGKNIELGHDFPYNAAGSAAGGSVQVTTNTNDAQGTTGQTCTTAEQCYPGIDAATLKGGVAVCMTQFTNGYCTHLCATDADCCGISGECPSGYPEVCGPFESTNEMYCFLSCEANDVGAAGLSDGTTYCQSYANRDFICRSTGGGAQNRKVCLPNG